MSALRTMTAELYAQALAAGYTPHAHDVSAGWVGACYHQNTLAQLLGNTDAETIAADCARWEMSPQQWQTGRRFAIEHTMWVFRPA